MKKLLFILMLVPFSIPHLPAGFVYHMQTTDHDVSPAQMSEGTIIIQGDKLLIKMEEDQSLVYDAVKREVTLIDHAQKEYQVLNQETFEKIAAQLNPMFEEMAKQLEQLPPERREMAEKMLKDRLPDQTPRIEIKLPEVRKTSEIATKAGYPCTRVELIDEGRKVSEVWVTDFDNVEGSEEAVRLFLDMGRFMKEMARSMVPGMQLPHSPFDQVEKYGGFPVVTIRYELGKVERETSLKKVQKHTFDSTEFEPPTGYERKQMIE